MKSSNLLSVMGAQAAAGTEVLEESIQSFKAAHVVHSGSVRVEAPAKYAFQLFTAPGEELWAPGWDPVVLSGGDGRQVGSVWLTTNGGENTIWLVVDFDSRAHHARYARITPGNRAGTVEVQVRGDGRDGSIAEVTYELTALTEAGNRYLAEFGEFQFGEMLTEWGTLIRAAEIDYAALLEQH